MSFGQQTIVFLTQRRGDDAGDAGEQGTDGGSGVQSAVAGPGVAWMAFSGVIPLTA